MAPKSAFHTTSSMEKLGKPRKRGMRKGRYRSYSLTLIHHKSLFYQQKSAPGITKEPFIFAPKDFAPLQFRHHQIDKVVEPSR